MFILTSFPERKSTLILKNIFNNHANACSNLKHMKTFVLICMMTLFGVTNNSTVVSEEIAAKYQGFDGEFYTFTDSSNIPWEFDRIAPNVLETYDLSDDQYLNKRFKITYQILSELDENDDEVEVYQIQTLTLLNDK